MKSQSLNDLEFRELNTMFVCLQRTRTIKNSNPGNSQTLFLVFLLNYLARKINTEVQ